MVQKSWTELTHVTHGQTPSARMAHSFGAAKSSLFVFGGFDGFGELSRENLGHWHIFEFFFHQTRIRLAMCTTDQMNTCFLALLM